MSIKIKQPEALYELGGRELNEDFVYPLMNEANPDERLFMVSDGEGGAQAGDVGSKLLTLTMAKYFQHPGPKGDVDQEFLDKALSMSEAALTAHKDGHPEAKHMAMSLALLHLGEEQVSLAWLGSSRVYYYNSEKSILLNPHSPEVQGNEAQQDLITGSESPQKLHLHQIPNEEINSGDFFLLVTDGVRDQLNDRNLETLFKSSSVSTQQYNPERVATEINNLIQNFSKDNYSAYIVQVADTEEKNSAEAVPLTSKKEKKENSVLASFRKNKASKESKEPAATVNAVKEENEAKKDEEPDKQRDLIRIGSVVALVIFLLFLIGYGGYNYFNNAFDRQMSRGNSAMEQQDFEEARNYFTKALQGTDDPAEKQRARNQLERLDILSKDQPDDRLQSADKFMEEGQFESAINLYETVIKGLDNQQDQARANQVRTLLAEAYIKQANQVYDSVEAAKKCELAYPIYQEGLILLDQPGVTSSQNEMIALANRRSSQCGKELGEKPVKPDGINARKVGPAIAQKTESEEKTTEVVRSVSPNTNARVRQPAESSELKKWLAAGKRIFVKARASGSEYQYREAAESLENAGPMLDGSGAYMLSFLYHMGLGVEKNESKALSFAQKSANKGWPAGQFYYGHLLLLRQYPRDTVTAIQSLRKSADQNYRDAIERLQILGARY